MKFIEQNNKLEQLDQILRQNRTGPAPKIADKMGVCERTVHNLLDILRAFGAKISYNKHRESYSYKNKVNIQFFKVRIENDDEIKGGANFLYFFSSLQDSCILPSDLCPKLKDEEEQNGAGSFRFPRSDD